jgi:hypothetical protein
VTAARHRDWGESAALFVSLVLFAALRNRYTIGTPAVTLAFGVLIAIVFLLSLFSTIAGERKQTRWVMLVAALLLATAVALSLIKVVYLVVYQAATINGIRLLETSLLIWVNNVIVFAIIYHLIGEREFAFPHSDQEPVGRPMNFLDYVFLSFTTATAFSPTDTSPLSTRVRMCMMFESIISLVAIAIAAARAINILPS